MPRGVLVDVSNSPGNEPSADRVLGRFLIVGLVAGSLIGGVVGLILMVPAEADFTVAAVVVGVALGLIAGLVAQAVAFSIVMLLWRWTARREGMARLVMYAPVPLAALTAWGVASWGQVSLTREFAAVSAAALLAFMAIAATAGWCLAPLIASSSRQGSLERPE